MLNDCFRGLRLREHINLKQLEEIIQLQDFKLNRIFNFLQFRYHNAEHTDFECFKRKALSDAIESAENASIEKVIVNIPIQHFSSNLSETYSLELEREQSLQEHIAHLNKVIEADVLTQLGEHSGLTPYHRANWIQPPPRDLSHVTLKQHYQM